jgi:hypothetical protein
MLQKAARRRLALCLFHNARWNRPSRRSLRELLRTRVGGLGVTPSVAQSNDLTVAAILSGDGMNASSRWGL